MLMALIGALAALADGVSFTAGIDGDKQIVDCSDIQMEFWNHRRGDVVTVRRDRTVALSGSASTALKVSAPDRGGIRVQPSAQGSYSATICMAVGADSREEGEKLLDRPTIERKDGGLTVNGPDGESWGAYILLSVPKNVTLDLSARNGDLTLRDVSGRFTLNTTNGPISITNVTGQVSGEAVNGPIEFRGHTGDIHLTAQNGPIEVELDDVSWSGKGLDAATQNGPVMLVAPSAVRTGVCIQSSQHSPVKWSGPNGSPEELPGGERIFMLGTEPIRVQLSTVNGPIEVKGPVATRPRAREI
jgi:hypothetical protein